MKSLLVCILALSSLACGPADKKPTQSGGPEPSEALGLDAGTGDTAANATPTLSEADCEVLFAHVFELIFASQRESLPADERPTDEDLRTAKDALRAELFGQCVGATREAFQYDCAIAATTPAQMQSCIGAE